MRERNERRREKRAEREAKSKIPTRYLSIAIPGTGLTRRTLIRAPPSSLELSVISSPPDVSLIKILSSYVRTQILRPFFCARYTNIALLVILNEANAKTNTLMANVSFPSFLSSAPLGSTHTSKGESAGPRLRRLTIR